MNIQLSDIQIYHKEGSIQLPNERGLFQMINVTTTESKLQFHKSADPTSHLFAPVEVLVIQGYLEEY